MKIIKRENLGLIFTTIICSLLVISDFITLATSTASLTYYGVITGILALVIMDFCIEELIDEMQ